MIRMLVAALLGVGALGAEITAPLRAADPPAAAIDSIFARYDRTTTPGCALGVYRDDRIVYARGYGMADLNQGIPIGPSTVFYIASTSKQFAAMSIALLAESILTRLCRIAGGGAYARHSPLGFWFEDVRALGFLRPPWALAADALFAFSTEAEPGH